MTKGGRISAGIISIGAGGLSILFALLAIVLSDSAAEFTLGWILLISGAIAVVGGILLIVDLMTGGILGTCAGGVGIVSSLFYFAFINEWSKVFFLFIFAICFALALASGIISITVRSDKL
ncbi:MAG: hypothetical protein HWN65_21645 [Candidatus Helarchaeota archaeon]|nr:hypothetical protein [Candidatus Helarchaeota archaeon]